LKLFVVAVPRFSARHKYINQHLREISSLPTEIVGVDGANTPRTPDIISEAAKGFSAGQMGCSLAHASACRRICELGLEWAVVVEDDVVLPKNFDEIINIIAEHIRPGELISLYNPTMKSALYSTYGSTAVQEMRLLYPMQLRSLRTTAVYVIHRDAACAIADGNKPVKYTADDYRDMYTDGLIKFIRVLQPSPVRIKGFPSTIRHVRKGSLKTTARTLVNSIPGLRTFMEFRRRWLRAKRLNNVETTDEPSPLMRPNPAFRQCIPMETRVSAL